METTQQFATACGRSKLSDWNYAKRKITTKFIMARLRVLITRTAATATLAVALMLAADAASATPFFANQTGLDCLSCHNNPPADRSAANDLTAAGRRFKDSGFNTSIFSTCHKEIQPDGTVVQVCK
jgi:hypothetical protein